MEWCFGSGVDDLIVPKDGGLSDRLPSPDSWSKWGIGAFESVPSRYKDGDFDQKYTAEEYNFNETSLYDEVEMEDSVYDKYQSSTSSACEGLSYETFQRNEASSNRSNYQLALAGSGQIDDIFLSSLLEDLPGIENLDKSFCSSPKSQFGVMKSDNILKDMTLNSQNTSSDVQSLGSSRYLKTHAYSPPLGSRQEGSTASKFVAHNSQQKDFPPVQAPSIEASVASEHSSMNKQIDEETSFEEAVLQELKMVMNQLTEKTRISFRDALYRLANNSKQHHMRQNKDGELSVENPSLWALDTETRSGTKRATEAETNIIDRAIANLMFNKKDFNIRDLPEASSSNSEEEIGGVTEPSSDYQSYTSQIHHSNGHQILPDDAEVPILGQMYPCLMENMRTGFQGNGAGNESMVLEFGSMSG
ncbi:hypothetical protein TorRG33x02_053510 [Trema orientale]|uniref:Protein LNK3 n=1 Tax=Trema orientale TaxID=63057 RepID=A0A2P5FLT4_TREOI|nr:hypothetical protein TorRG33x02_053510 [Trema orientale]